MANPTRECFCGSTHSYEADDTWFGHEPTVVEQLDAAFHARGLAYLVSGDASELTVETQAGEVLVIGDYTTVHAWMLATGVDALALIAEPLVAAERPAAIQEAA